MGTASQPRRICLIWFMVRPPSAHNACMPTEPEAPLSEGAARRAARLATPRLQREMATMAAMMRIYCRDHHGHKHATRKACVECAGLMDYAQKRLAACPFGPEKPTCANCQIHCYGPKQREETRVVMRYAGPRMLLRHPILAIAHLMVDSRRPAPPKPRGAAAATRLPPRAD
jgi:hypothetical protein